MKRLILLTAVLGLFLVSTAPALGPGDILWTRTYGGADKEKAYSVQQTVDGGYIIAGATESFGAGSFDSYLVKTNADGDTLWTRTYGGGSKDWAYFVQQTSDGGYVVAGYTRSFGAGAEDFYLVKTDSVGDTLWTRTYGGSSYDVCKSVQQTPDGGYILAGPTKSFGAGDEDFYLVKTDSVGGLLWDATYGGKGYDRTYSVDQTTDGGYMVAGMTGPGSFGIESIDFYLVKTDSVGDTLWTRTYGGSSDDIFKCGQQTTDGGYILAGFTESFGAGKKDVYQVKTDSLGNFLWQKNYGGSEDDKARPVRQTSDGGYILGGHTRSFGTGDSDVYLVKTDSVGDTLWTRTYGGSSDDFCMSAQQTSDGGYILAGYTESFGAGSDDFYVVKTVGTVTLECDSPTPWLCRGKVFYFKLTVANLTQRDVSGTMTFSAYSGYGCNPDNVMITIPRMKTYPPGVDTSYYYLQVPRAALPGQYSVSIGGILDPGGYELFCCMEIEIMECSPWKTGSNTSWQLVELDHPEVEPPLPAVTCLFRNFPNPFNAATVIGYELAGSDHVNLEIYNLLGQKIITLVDEKQEAGYKSVRWDVSKVSSGLYFYRLTAGDYSETKRMMVVK